MEKTFVVEPSDVSKGDTILRAARALNGVVAADYANLPGDGSDEEGRQNWTKSWYIVVKLSAGADTENIKSALEQLDGVLRIQP